MQSLVTWYHANQALFWTLFVGVVSNIANALGKMPVDNSSKFSVALHFFLDRILPTILTKSDAQNTLKLPWMASKTSNGAAAKLQGPTMLLPWLAFGCLALSACAFCQVPANKGTVECKAFALLTQCGPGIVEVLLADAAGFASDLDGTLADLAAKLGPEEYACVSRVLMQSAAAKFGEGSPKHLAMKAAFEKHPMSTRKPGGGHK